jgi:hypothetical protein
MCLLTFIPDGVMPDMEKFRVAAVNNPDGFGFAILGDDRILTGHSMSFEEAAEQFIDLRSRNSGPALFHFRWATHGSETIDNCHPFFLGQDGKSVVAHNGILPVKILKGDDRSDTKVFAEDIMPAIGGIVALDDDEYFKKLSQWATGSKLAFLTLNDDAKYNWYLVNEQDGHWADDMWWSNDGYKSVSRYKSYGYGWGGHYWDDWDREYASYSTDQKFATTKWEQEEIDLMVDVCMEQFDVFMTPVSAHSQVLDCYACSYQEMCGMDDMPTHCPSCESCLYCGNPSGCACWNVLFEHFNMPVYKSPYYNKGVSHVRS